MPDKTKQREFVLVSLLTLRMSRVLYFGQHVAGVYSHPIPAPNPQELPLLYSDGATSCLLCFVCGERDGEWTICFGHLDDQPFVEEFFGKVLSTFQGVTNRIQLYAIGAVDYTAPDGSNCGDKLQQTLHQQLTQFNMSDAPVEGKIWLQFADQSHIFNKFDISGHESNIMH